MQPADRRACSREEEVLVVNPAGAPEALPERQLALEHGDCTGRAPIAARLGDILVHTPDARLCDAQRSTRFCRSPSQEGRSAPRAGAR